MNNWQRPAHLGNWRKTPHNQWAFHHVRELIPTANIRHDPSLVCPLPQNRSNKLNPEHLDAVLKRSWTDGFLVLHQGSIAYEWYASHYDGIEPHVLFSVSKSLTGTLAGALVERGQLDVDKPVSTYIPDAAGSAYEECTVRHVLDMQVGLDFAEVYTGENEQFNRYRCATGWDLPATGGQPGNLRSFLTAMRPSGAPHGQVFRYMSPNTDMMGLILESASRKRLWDLLSEHIWQPLGAESDAYITVDAEGTPRAAGGICVRLRDLARFGQMMCNGGVFNGRQIIPADWIEDTLNHGSFEAWRLGTDDLMPKGRYRNYWYQIKNPTRAFCAIGIHGQWIYVDPTMNVVIVKLSSQPEPLDNDVDRMLLDFYGKVSLSFH